MGAYYFLVCCRSDGRIVAHFNPQHGFGGLKYSEFIGTDNGKQITEILTTHFCPETCQWKLISDCNISAYHEMQTTKDFALNATLRKIAIENNIATVQTLSFFDNITNTLYNTFTKRVCDLPATLEEVENNL